jgi:hypothetical protein
MNQTSGFIAAMLELDNSIQVTDAFIFAFVGFLFSKGGASGSQQ